jgi:hypothetical protein
VGAAYAGIVTGRPVKGVNAGMDSWAPLLNKDRTCDECKGTRDVKISFRDHPEINSPRGEQNVKVGTTADGHVVTQPAAPKKTRESLKPTANDTVSLPVLVTSMEATLSRRAPGEVSGPTSGKPAGTTTPSGQVDRAAQTEERSNNAPLHVSGVRYMRKFLGWIRAKSGELAAMLKSEYLMLVLESDLLTRYDVLPL